MRVIITFLGMIFFGCSYSFAQQVNWITFDELPQKMRDNPRPVLVFIHTDWCKFCAMQESNTFTNKEVVKALSENVYALRLNAEEKDDIVFLNRKYAYKPTGTGSGYHELAELLGKEKGVLNFPTTLLLSDALEIVFRHPGLLKTDKLLNMLATVSVENTVQATGN